MAGVTPLPRVGASCDWEQQLTIATQNLSQKSHLNGFKVAAVTSSVAKITFVEVETTFNVVVITPSVADTSLLVAKITFVVAEITFKVAVITS